jgi:hypothetical protein
MPLSWMRMSGWPSHSTWMSRAAGTGSTGGTGHARVGRRQAGAVGDRRAACAWHGEGTRRVRTHGERAALCQVSSKGYALDGQHQRRLLAQGEAGEGGAPKLAVTPQPLLHLRRRRRGAGEQAGRRWRSRAGGGSPRAGGEPEAARVSKYSGSPRASRSPAGGVPATQPSSPHNCRRPLHPRTHAPSPRHPLLPLPFPALPTSFLMMEQIMRLKVGHASATNDCRCCPRSQSANWGTGGCNRSQALPL